MKILECVPNFSEGRDLEKIGQIAKAIESVKRVSLLDVDSSQAANRTVMTFVGEPDAVVQAAYLGIAKASELIDMRQQEGVHPRIGACDVCPFVPLTDLTMDECVDLSMRLAEKVGRILKIPVYLYAYSATADERRKLSYIRRGQYEGFAERMASPDFRPDFGPHEFNQKAGATVVGARDILIAYNINLSSIDGEAAKRIASKMRRKRGATNPYDGFAADPEGHAGLKSTTAIGWAIPEFKLCQISTNLLDYRWFGLFDAYNEVKRLAGEEGIELNGSELVGLLPEQAILSAGEQVLNARDPETSPRTQAPEDLINAAIDYLGLSTVKQFDPKMKILDYRLRKLDMLLNI
jgi:glutamate formiminotransferase / formiminotetrahydrofolate cyclodeaminase